MTEWYHAIVDTSVDSTTVLSTPALVGGVYVNTALSAHTVNIEDGTDVVIILPASTSAGAVDLGLGPGDGIRFETSLVVDPDNSSTGNITVLYKPLR